MRLETARVREIDRDEEEEEEEAPSMMRWSKSCETDWVEYRYLVLCTYTYLSIEDEEVPITHKSSPWQ